LLFGIFLYLQLLFQCRCFLLICFTHLCQFFLLCSDWSLLFRLILKFLKLEFFLLSSHLGLLFMVEGVLLGRLEAILSLIVARGILLFVIWLTHHSRSSWRCSEIYHLLIYCSISSNRARKLRRWIHLTLLHHVNVFIVCSCLALNNIWILANIYLQSIHMSWERKLWKSFRIHGLRIVNLVLSSVISFCWHMSHNFSLSKLWSISLLINSKVRQLIVYLHFC